MSNSDDGASTPSEKAVTKRLYEDALKPVAEGFGEHAHDIGDTLGKSAKVVVHTVDRALDPFRAAVWGYDQIIKWVKPELKRKLSEIPPERIIEPVPEIAGPAMEHMRFLGYRDELRDMFVNLLATSMDSETAKEAHPAFVEIIKQITPDEARILKFMAQRPQGSYPILEMRRRLEGQAGYKILHRNVSHLGSHAGCSHEDLVPTYLDNLSRLKVCSLEIGVHIMSEGAYDALCNDEGVVQYVSAIESSQEGVKVELMRGIVTLTTLGQKFVAACVSAKNEPTSG